MSAGSVLLTCAGICVGASLIIALLFRFWPRYGSVEAVIERTDRMLADMERTSAEP